MKQPPLAADPPVERIGTGIACLVAAAFCFSVTDALAKWLGQDYAAIEILFFRYLFGMLPVAVLIWYGGGLAALRTRRPGVHALRAGLLFLALYLFFEALQHIPLADAIAAAFTAPLFITAMSGPVLGETVGFRRWAAVLAGFIGAALVADATDGPRSDPADIVAFLEPMLAPPVQQGLAGSDDDQTQDVLAEVSPLLLQFDENRSVRQGPVAIDHTQVGAARFAG